MLKVFEICESKNIPATLFEIVTALSFLYFKEENCQAIVLEVGLGGRLDATNIVKPDLCVITSIHFDHMKILGDTIELIAIEKAGIMKSGVPILVGPGCPIDVMKVQLIIAISLLCMIPFVGASKENGCTAVRARGCAVRRRYVSNTSRYQHSHKRKTQYQHQGC